MDVVGCGMDEEVEAALDADAKLSLLDKVCREGGAVLLNECGSNNALPGGAYADGLEFGGLLYVLV